MKEYIKPIARILTSPSVVLILCFWGCKKVVAPAGTPTCIKSKIQNIARNKKENPSIKVWKYQYESKTVYYFTSYCCNQMSELVDENCNIVCHLDGGFTGHGDGKCSDFFQKRTKEELI